MNNLNRGNKERTKTKVDCSWAMALGGWPQPMCPPAHLPQPENKKVYKHVGAHVCVALLFIIFERWKQLSVLSSWMDTFWGIQTAAYLFSKKKMKFEHTVTQRSLDQCSQSATKDRSNSNQGLSWSRMTGTGAGGDGGWGLKRSGECLKVLELNSKYWVYNINIFNTTEGKLSNN